MPSRAYLLECFRYYPETGELFWNERPLAHFRSLHVCRSWNAKRANKQAAARQFTRKGKPSSLWAKLDGEKYRVHRIIWVMIHGEISENMTVDHRDGNPFNNLPNNLRLATLAQNSWNSDTGRKDGKRGIDLLPSGRFRARIQHRRRFVGLGTFDTEQDARAALASFIMQHRGEFVRTQEDQTDQT